MAKRRETEETEVADAATEQEGELVLLTPLDFIKALRAWLKDVDPEATLQAGEIKDLLNRVLLPGETFPQAMDSAVLHVLREHVKANPQSGGDSASNIWRKVRATVHVPLEDIEAALESLTEDGKITVEKAGGFSLYLPATD